MEDDLLDCLNELKLIRKYLIKKGKARYKGNIIKNKLCEVEIIYEKSKELIKILSTKQGVKSELLKSLSVYKTEIESCYLQIIDLCTESKSDSDSESKFSEASQNPVLIMEFDLKTACSLIPVMTNNENKIKNIIDSVEMYADMLSETGKSLLIKFVLKSRLSESAKLRISSDYTSVSDLVRDLRNSLLPKKSFTAIQSQLQNATQDWRTIDQYGIELEKLFTDLTISQADGNSQNYSVLKPINEKLAIKRFADGLRDTRLSTIIAARNYCSLKDAIQAAKDEELTSASTSVDEDVMQFSRQGKGKSQNNSSFRTNDSGASNRQYGHRGYQNHQNSNYSRGNFNPTNFRRGNFNRGNSRGRSFYGSRGTNNYRGSSNNSSHGRGYQASNENQSSNETHSSGNNNRVFCTNESDENESLNPNTNEMQFFRSET